MVPLRILHPTAYARPARDSYPEILRAEIAHATRFTSALRALLGITPPPIEAALLWLEGRPEEVEAFVSDVLCSWEAGDVASEIAAYTIEEYLASLHTTLEGWYGRWYAPSCCGPLATTPPDDDDSRASRVRVVPRKAR